MSATKVKINRGNMSQKIIYTNIITSLVLFSLKFLWL